MYKLQGGALQAAEKLQRTGNHPGARRATPPESGGELLKVLPSSGEEGWRAERRGGCPSFSAASLAPPFLRNLTPNYVSKPGNQPL